MSDTPVDLGDLIQSGQAFFNVKAKLPFNGYKKLVGERLQRQVADGYSLSVPLTILYGFGPFIRPMRNEAEASSSTILDLTDAQVLQAFLIQLKEENFAGWKTNDVDLPPIESYEQYVEILDEVRLFPDEAKMTTETPVPAGSWRPATAFSSINSRNSMLLILAFLVLGVLLMVVCFHPSMNMLSSPQLLTILAVFVGAATIYLLVDWMGKGRFVAASFALATAFLIILFLGNGWDALTSFARSTPPTEAKVEPKSELPKSSTQWVPEATAPPVTVKVSPPVTKVDDTARKMAKDAISKTEATQSELSTLRNRIATLEQQKTDRVSNTAPTAPRSRARRPRNEGGRIRVRSGDELIQWVTSSSVTRK